MHLRPFIYGYIYGKSFAVARRFGPKTTMLIPLLTLISLTQPSHAIEVREVAKATNPFLFADVPDTAIIRVGTAYYMSSTTMHMSPGLPIMKSNDLINWKIVSYAYNTLGTNDALTLQNGKSAYGAGSWASSLRFHNGTFYVSTFSSTTGKTYIFSTKDPEREPWKEISFSPSFHDHSLFFDDDGKTYLIHGSENLRLTELKPDLSGPLAGGVDQVIVTNASAVAGGRLGLRAEGSQMFKVNGQYYLCNITWPQGSMRTEIVHRADKITGPYEGHIMFKDRGIAQGGMIDTPDGRWFAYLFRDSGAVGRMPWLVPMKWVDGWPVVGTDGKATETLDLPSATLGTNGIVASDEFTRRPGDRPLPLAWQWNHNPDDANWSVTARKGFLRLTTSRVDAEVVRARNTLTQRTFGPESSATVSLDASELKDGDFAGLVALQRKYGWVGIGREEGKYFVAMTSAQNDMPQEIERVPIAGKKAFLRIDCDFKPGADRAYFYYSTDGKAWQPIGKPLQMRYDLPHFMGYRFGLFNFSTKTPGGHADFDYYRIGSKVLESH